MDSINNSKPLAMTGSAPAASEEPFQEVALRLRSMRQLLIASNIANADTPNYKARDIAFKDSLQAALASAQQPPLKMARSAEGHVAGGLPASSSNPPLLYTMPYQASLDQNTVEMDVERAKFSENTIKYEFTIMKVMGRYKEMEDLLKKMT